MRDYKFRGLTYTREWVYGDLIYDAVGSTTYYNEFSQRICWFFEWGGQANAPVKNGTVGQLLNIKDKNGKNIYEGDIVLKYLKEGPCNREFKSFGKVFYDIEEARYKINHHENLYCGIIGQTIEIIGNIYENPELVKLF